MNLREDIEAILPGAFNMPHTEHMVRVMRDAIYHRTAYVDADNGYGAPDNWTQHSMMFNRAVRTGEGFACGGRALLYLTMLQALGIEARYVGMWSETINLGQGGSTTARSHASVDVWVNGRWIASDPHFNLGFVTNPGGPSLSWKQVHERVAAGQPVLATTEGYNQDHFLNTAKMVAEYPVEEMVTHMILGPSFNHEPEIVGPWDSVLHYVDGRQFSTLNMVNAPHYRIVAAPPAT